jgi:quinol monooxygenase YgiN
MNPASVIRQPCSDACFSAISAASCSKAFTDLGLPIPSYMKSDPNLALLVRLEAKPGKEAETEQFLKAGLAIAQEEPGTTTWFALKLGPSTFGIFDTFVDETGREAHLSGRLAAALMQKASELLAQPPTIEKVAVLAAKLS